MRTSTKARIERLLAEARKIVWKPHSVFLTGQPGEYTLTVDEWDGVPGSGRDGNHRKQFVFNSKDEAVNFAVFAFPNVRRCDLSILTDEEWNAIRPKTVLEERAERDGKPLQEAVMDVYGYIPDFWKTILELERTM